MEDERWCYCTFGLIIHMELDRDIPIDESISIPSNVPLNFEDYLSLLLASTGVI